MNTAWTHFASLAARILLALIFIQSGFGKLTALEATAGYIASKGLPMPQVLAAGAAAVELLGGILLVVGWKARWAAAAIFAFLVPTTYFFHNPLGVPPDQARMETIQLMKNLAIMGGMLMVIAFGPGGWSLDGAGVRRGR